MPLLCDTLSSPVTNMPAPLNLTNQRFGRLTAKRVVRHDGIRKWECLCDCGNTAYVEAGYLRYGHTESCGCKKLEALQESQLAHEHARRGQRTPEYVAWAAAKQRCEDPNHKDFHSYGGRGIRVCPDWRYDFVAFLSHIGPKPSSKHTLDRVDPNGDYAPGNVRWATRSEQARNRRDATLLIHDGHTWRASDLAEHLGLRADVLVRAYKRDGSLSSFLNHPSVRAKLHARNTAP